MECSRFDCSDVNPERSTSAIRQKDTLDELFAEINGLEKLHASKHRSRTIAHHLQPLVSFVERYASAVDVAVQGSLNPASLIWGSLRAILVVTKSYSKYFDRVIATLERLGLVVAVYSEYEAIIGQSPAFRKSICLVYTGIIEFLQKSRKIFRRSGVNLFIQSISRDFEAEFQDTLNALSIHIKALRDQATLAYRQKLYQSIDNQTRLTSEIMHHHHLTAEKDKREEILKWLCPGLASEVLARETAKKLCPSGQWLFATSEFQEWRSGDTEILWLNGMPGTGKTILSTSIIEELARTNDETNGLVYFFCDKNDPSSGTPLSILSTLTYQLIKNSDELPLNVKSAFEQSQRSGRIRVSEADKPLELLRSAIQFYRKVYIVLDGLDESIEAERVIQDLRQLVQTSNTVSILIVSRDSSEIRKPLSKYPELRIESSQTQTDFKNYVSLAVGSSTFAQSDIELGDKVSQKLQSSANGIFLWASLMLEHLETATSPREVESSLLELPAGLGGVYASRLRSISIQGRAHREIFKHAACWILCAARPLTLSELCTALAISLTEDPVFDRSRKPFPRVVAKICSQFFVMDPVKEIMRPFHASVIEYLLGPVPDGNSDKNLEEFFLAEGECHQRIVQGCLALLATAFDSRCASSAISEPLTRYACLSWLQHVVKSTSNHSTHKMITDFMVSDCRRQWIWYFLQWQRNVFPLQRLFFLQSKLLVWLAEPPNTDLPTYFDWASDVILILLDSSHSKRISGENENNLQKSTGVHYIEALSHFEKMMVVRDLARHLNALKRLQHGVQLFESAYQEQEENEFDRSDVRFTWLLNALGILYDQEGHVAKATETQEQALCILNGTPNPNMAEIAWTQNELGRMYRHQSRLTDAENMHVKALQSMNDTTAGITTTELEIAWTLSTLGRVYRKQSRFKESIAQTEKALEMRQFLLGKEHPHCLWLLGDIAQCHFENGDYDQALRFHQEAYKGRKEILGDEHPDTLWSMNSIGVVLAKRAGDGDVAEAVQLQKSALEGQRRVLGPAHRHTMWTEAVLVELGERV